MNIGKSLSKAEKLITDNSPLILTCVGVIGTVATAVFTAKATFRAAYEINEETERYNLENGWSPDQAVHEGPDYEELTKVEMLKLVWTLYALPVGVGAATVTAIILAHKINTRRAAAILAGYVALEKSSEEYRDKVAEKLGIKKEQAIKDEIAQDTVDKYPPNWDGIIHTGKGNELFRDGPSGRYFYSSMEAVNKAWNDVNRQIINGESATLTQFYNNLGISTTEISEDFGWVDSDMLELEFSTCTTEDERRPCHFLKYNLVPMRDFRDTSHSVRLKSLR